MALNTLLDDLGQQAASRRSFLRAGGLAALVSAGALALGGQRPAHAAPAAQLGGSDIPPDAALTLHMLRSLTLLAMAATIKDPKLGARIEAVAHKELGRQLGALSQLGGTTGYTPDPDGPICPDWWPWPWPPRPYGDLARQPGAGIPKAGLAALDMFRTLSLYNLAFETDDGALRLSMQRLAVGELKGQLATLGGSGSLAGYDDGDGICPDWWPFPWPGPRPPAPRPTPDAALVLLDLAGSLTSYNIASRLGDAGSQKRLADQARSQARAQSKTLGGYMGSSAAWEPGDGICPDWWPWPWPGPRPLGSVLDPVASGDPDPEPNAAIRATFEAFRGATVFALASQLDDQSLALDLQAAAIQHVQQQVGML